MKNAGRRDAIPAAVAHHRIAHRDGTFPAAVAIGFHLVDYVADGWDVARTLGLDYDLKPDVLAVALAIAEAVPDDETRLRPGAAFAPGVTAPRDASQLDRIVALLGRRPDWRPLS